MPEVVKLAQITGRFYHSHHLQHFARFTTFPGEYFGSSLGPCNAGHTGERDFGS